MFRTTANDRLKMRVLEKREWARDGDDVAQGSAPCARSADRAGPSDPTNIRCRKCGRCVRVSFRHSLACAWQRALTVQSFAQLLHTPIEIYPHGAMREAGTRRDFRTGHAFHQA